MTDTFQLLPGKGSSTPPSDWLSQARQAHSPSPRSLWQKGTLTYDAGELVSGRDQLPKSSSLIQLTHHAPLGTFILRAPTPSRLWVMRIQRGKQKHTHIHTQTLCVAKWNNVTVELQKWIWIWFTVSAEQDVSGVCAIFVLDGASVHPTVSAGRLDDGQGHLTLISSTREGKKSGSS